MPLTGVARGEKMTSGLRGLQSEFHFMQRKMRLKIFQDNKVLSRACTGQGNQQSQVLGGERRGCSRVCAPCGTCAPGSSMGREAQGDEVCLLSRGCLSEPLGAEDQAGPVTVAFSLPGHLKVCLILQKAARVPHSLLWGPVPCSGAWILWIPEQGLSAPALCSPGPSFSVGDHSAH